MLWTHIHGNGTQSVKWINRSSYLLSPRFRYGPQQKRFQAIAGLATTKSKLESSEQIQRTKAIIINNNYKKPPEQ
jgi:hypothetical protein